MRLSKGRRGGAGQTRAGCSAAAVTVAWLGRETLLQAGAMRCEKLREASRIALREVYVSHETALHARPAAPR